MLRLYKSIAFPIKAIALVAAEGENEPRTDSVG
jgi:hypothetical protein